MAIFPQDRRAPVERVLSIPARIDDKIRTYAESLDGSDVEYTILAIVEHHFSAKPSNGAVHSATVKSAKESAKKGK
jgi:hypothetical protein